MQNSSNNIPILDFLFKQKEFLNWKFEEMEYLLNNSKIFDINIKISDILTMTFRDKFDLFPFELNDSYVFNMDQNGVLFRYENLTFIFKNFYIVEEERPSNIKKARFSELIIRTELINPDSKIRIWELIDEKYLVFDEPILLENEDIGFFYTGAVEDDETKKIYNAYSYFYYECQYNKINGWEKVIWNYYLMLRFFAGKLLFPQTQLILDDLENYEIKIRGFKHFGKATSIFYKPSTCFYEFINFSYENFITNPESYNLLFTYWINYHLDNFIEIKSLSAFVFFEVLLKNFSEENIKNKDFFEKLSHFFNQLNLNLTDINEFFYKEILNKIYELEPIFLERYPGDSVLIENIFKFYKEFFIVSSITFYRNKIVHSGEIMGSEEDIGKIINKLHSKLMKYYLNENKLPPKSVNDFKHYQNNEGTFWKGFRKGFKIADEQKNDYSENYKNIINPLLLEIKNSIEIIFINENLKLIDPIELFDRIMILILIRMLNINCQLINSPEFYIGGNYVENSQDFISRFLNED